jgi:hypothetical protein
MVQTAARSDLNSLALPAFVPALPEQLVAYTHLPERVWHQKALPIDTSFNQLPTLAVEIAYEGQALATWKCNVRTDIEGWLIFSPLVIVWAPEANRQHGQGQILMSAIAQALPHAARALGYDGRILLTSGNLTVERAGLPFFQSLGWPIVMSREQAGALCPHGPAALSVYMHLSAITAAYRAQHGGEVSFAYLLPDLV